MITSEGGEPALDEYYLSLSRIQNEFHKLQRYDYRVYKPAPARVKLTLQKTIQEHQLTQK